MFARSELNPNARPAKTASADVPAADHRSFRVDLLIAALLGGAGFSLAYLTWWAIAIAAFLAGLALVVDVRSRHRRTRLSDDRAVGVNFGVYFLTMPLFFLAWLFLDTPPKWWQAGLLGLAMFGGYLSYARIIQRYELRRLADGDYSPYDLS